MLEPIIKKEDLSKTSSTGMNLAEIIKARILVAQNIPRDMEQIRKNVSVLAKDKAVASKALYCLPRKNKGKMTYIEGLSMSFIKELAREYGHFDYGFKEIGRGATHSRCFSYCYDLKSNGSETREWVVKLPSYVLAAKNQSEEVYKFIYSSGAKRERGCIERLLPESLQEFAIREIKASLETSVKKQMEAESPMKRFAKALTALREIDNRIEEFDVLDDVLKKANVESIDEKDIATLQGVYNSLRDKVTVPAEHFPRLKEEEAKEAVPATQLDSVKDDDFYKR